MISSRVTSPLDKDYSIQIENFLELPCNVYMKDTKGIYRECNSVHAESFGAARIEDILGRTDMQLHPIKEDCRIFAMNDAEVIKAEAPKIFIEPITFVNRPTVNMLSHKIPCHNKQGKIIGVFGVSVPLDNVQQFPLTSSSLTEKNPPIQVNQNQNEYANIKVSKREKECLTCLAKGMTAKEIARVLNLSPRTIEFYIENMKKKYRCNNRIQLIAKAYDILG